MQDHLCSSLETYILVTNWKPNQKKQEAPQKKGLEAQSPGISLIFNDFPSDHGRHPHKCRALRHVARRARAAASSRARRGLCFLLLEEVSSAFFHRNSRKKKKREENHGFYPGNLLVFLFSFSWCFFLRFIQQMLRFMFCDMAQLVLHLHRCSMHTYHGHLPLTSIQKHSSIPF